jgi:hypothetical protein
MNSTSERILYKILYPGYVELASRCGVGGTLLSLRFGPPSATSMYNQRRALAPASFTSDADARNTNMTLMQGKRRQVLEAQLAEKMELLKQFTNPRGIGMRGQTVPQRDVEILQEQINALRQQLNGPQYPSLESNLPPTPAYGMEPQARPGPIGPTPASLSSALPNRTPHSEFPMAPSSSTSSRSSKRDMVWQQKYEAWLRRSSASRGTSSTAPAQVQTFASAAVAQVNVFDSPRSQVHSVSSGFTAPHSTNQGMNPFSQPNSAQVHQDPPRYGRRATPPSEYCSGGHEPTIGQHAERPGGPQVPSPVAVNGNQPLNAHFGRRRVQESSRPW